MDKKSHDNGKSERGNKDSLDGPDYKSAFGWDPVREKRERLLAEAEKNNPRLYAEPPEMLYVRPIEEFVESGANAGAMKQLFGPFWLEEELAVMFGPTGLGKSLLAVQIGESLARGVAMAPFDDVKPGCEVGPQRVLYLDFELTRVQLAQRYVATGEDGRFVGEKYQFSPNLLRAELYWDGRLIDGYEDFTDMLFEDIGARIDEHGARVLICDNITFLSQRSTANASIAFRLMNRLQDLKKNRFISILAVAHTPKHPPHLPLTMNDLQGSVDLAKVADSMFALGRSKQGIDLRYLKHVKSRTGRIEHGEDNVAVYSLGKFDQAVRMGVTGDGANTRNFLGYDFIGFENETAHLAPRPNRIIGRPVKKRKLAADRVAFAKALAGKGLSLAAIAEKLGVGKTTAYRYVSGAGCRA